MFTSSLIALTGVKILHLLKNGENKRNVFNIHPKNYHRCQIINCRRTTLVLLYLKIIKFEILFKNERKRGLQLILQPLRSTKIRYFRPRGDPVLARASNILFAFAAQRYLCKGGRKWRLKRRVTPDERVLIKILTAPTTIGIRFTSSLEGGARVISY